MSLFMKPPFFLSAVPSPEGHLSRSRRAANDGPSRKKRTLHKWVISPHFARRPRASGSRGRGLALAARSGKLLGGDVGVNHGPAAHRGAIRNLGVLPDRRDAGAVGGLLAARGFADPRLPSDAHGLVDDRALHARSGVDPGVGQDDGL